MAEGRTLTFAQVDEVASGVAARLAAEGVSAGARVSTTLPPGLGFAALLHALPRLGAALAPLDPRAPADPSGLLVDRPVDGRGHGPDRPEVPDHEVHTVIRSSGTTGTPKAIELTYANHAAGAVASRDALGSEPDDRWLCPLPLHHVGGLNVLIRSAIHRTTAIVHQRFDAARVRAAIENREATLVSLVPTMLARLREEGLTRAPGLRAVALGGGPVPPSLLDWAADVGLPVVPVYGMTETCSQIVAGIPGRPLAGVELSIAGDGEILVRGPMVARGSISADGWLHTGDRGRLDGAGLLHVDGRLKDLIITGGENVSPSVVEAALTSHPAVADVGVTGRDDAEWGEAVVALVVLREQTADADLIEWCRARLSPHEVPKRVERVAALPRNAAGKLLRARL